MKQTLKIATRKSALALAQSNHVASLLQDVFPALAVELVPMQTVGDQRLDKALGEIGDKGLFVKELEEALLAGVVDVAIHSMKDMPTTLPAGLGLLPIGEREDPRDAWLNLSGLGLMDVPEGTRVGTSSIRRVNRLKQLRPDVMAVPIRGNVNTRLKKMEEGEVDALILASAGLIRLGLATHITEFLNPESRTQPWLPAPAQGVLAAEFREDKPEIREILKVIQHPHTIIQAQTERAALKAMESGCHVPFSAYSTVEMLQKQDKTQGQVSLTIQHIHLEATQNLQLHATASFAEAETLGRTLGEKMRKQLKEKTQA